MAPLHSCSDIREQAKQIEKSVSSKEPRFVLRVLRALPATRRRLNALVLKRLLHTSYTHSAQERDTLLAFVEEVRPAAETVCGTVDDIKRLCCLVSTAGLCLTHESGTTLTFNFHNLTQL